MLVVIGNSLHATRCFSITQRAGLEQLTDAVPSTELRVPQPTSEGFVQKLLDISPCRPFLGTRNSVLGTRNSALIDRCRRLQIDLLPLALDDASANLGCGLARLVLLIRVIDFLQARGASRSMRAFEAAVQAVVAHAVAITVARLLWSTAGILDASS